MDFSFNDKNIHLCTILTIEDRYSIAISHLNLLGNSITKYERLPELELFKRFQVGTNVYGRSLISAQGAFLYELA